MDSKRILNPFIHRSARKWQLALVLMLAYAPLWFGAYQFDDYNVIVFYEPIHSLAGWWGNLGHGLRPILKLSYCLNWVLPAQDMRLFGFHFVNLCVHVLNTWLVYAVVLRLPHMSVATQPKIALLVAAFFALHPANTEAVTYISGRSVSLMMMYAMLCWLAWQIAQTRAVKSGWLTLSLLAYFLAIACKEIAVLMPLGMWLAEWTLRRDSQMGIVTENLRWHLGMMLAIMLLLLFMPAYWHLMYNAASKASLLDNLLVQLRGVSYLLWQWFWPVQMNIDPDLQHIADWKIGLVLSLLAIVFFLMIRTRSALSAFACAWFFLWLLPVYVFMPRLDVVNERQLYLAAWPLFLPVAAWFVTHLQESRWAPACLASVLLVLGALTFARNLDYTSEISLWQATAAASPNKSRVHNNLAYAYAQAGYTKEALLHYRRAIALKPDNWLAINNLERLEANASATKSALP